MPCMEAYGGPQRCSASWTPRTDAAWRSAWMSFTNHLRARRQLRPRLRAYITPTSTTRRGDRPSTWTTSTPTASAISSARTAIRWLREFHIDALRLDAVHALVDEALAAHLGRAVRAGGRDPAQPAPSGRVDRRIRLEPTVHGRAEVGRRHGHGRAMGRRCASRAARLSDR